MICPTCSHDTLDPGLSVNLDAEEMQFLGERRALTRDQAKLMAALHRRFALIVSYEGIESILWGERIDGGPEGARNVIKMQMSLLRRKLRGWPYVITCHYNSGYSLCRVENLSTDGGRCKALKEVRAA